MQCTSFTRNSQILVAAADADIRNILASEVRRHGEVSLLVTTIAVAVTVRLVGIGYHC